MEKVTVLRSAITTGSYHRFIDEVFSLVEHKIPSYVCFANVHMVIEGYKDDSFQEVINEANLVAPDGKPISLFVSHLSKHSQHRICGMDILPDLLKQAEAQSKSVYFYGTTDELLSSITQKAKREFPLLRISGQYSPPFRNLTESEKSSIINQIRFTSPDLVFVSLGCPKQEKWMAENRDKIGACLLGVGQAFKVYAGEEKRLPKWMRNLSLEWLYRLYLEPQRLWKRYLVTNSYFLILSIGFLFKEFIHKPSTPLTGTVLLQDVFKKYRSN